MMKKIILLISVVLFLLNISCTRSEFTNPDPTGPAGYKYIVEGSANPSLIVANGVSHSTDIAVHVTDHNGNSLTGRNVYFEQRHGDDRSVKVFWGFFSGNVENAVVVTDSQGYARITYWGPKSIMGSDQLVYIKATVADIDQSYYDIGLPYDYIAIRILSY
ncbi:MAG: hypothetical protein ABFR75_00410 [Acidobacteriota bacterium]